MLSIDFLGNGLGIVFRPYFMYHFFKKNISRIILTDQIPLPDCLYFLRY